MSSAYASPEEVVPRKGVPTATTLSVDMSEQDRKWRDLPWAIAFYIHALVVIILAFAVGIPEISDDENKKDSSGTTTNTSGPNINGGAAIGVLSAVAFISLFVSFGWIYLLMNKAKVMIQTLVVANIVVMLLGFVIVGAATGQWVFAIIGFGIPGAIMLCWYFFVRNRIPFAAATLEVSCMAVLRYKCSFGFAFASLGVELVWVILWALATIGVGEAVNSFAITIILLISFYWTSTVIKNVVHTTVSGTVGTWWTQRDPDDPTWNAFKRASTKSFGSISLISLLIAIVKTMHYLASQAQREAEGPMAFVWCIVRCIVHCLLRLLEYFSDYALVHVALYGKALVPAAKDTWNMFKERGWDAIINDSLYVLRCTPCRRVAIIYFQQAVQHRDDFKFLRFYCWYYFCCHRSGPRVCSQG
eukprot:gb/GECG01012416.1/.p1 GENE.gb/GECG01012416.1/~~gb/GECG01012416.1/.p1  ORF type:complete len:416 (+),score=23.12 gb/GECG01012416.1/:1-1248(+)